jgi:hypothetical protein
VHVADIQEAKGHLKPTETVVRTTLSVVSCSSDYEETKTERKQREKANLDSLHAALTAIKSSLKPTETVIRSLPIMVQQESVVSSSVSAGTSLGHLICDGGWEEMHGFRGKSSWEAPVMVTRCDVEARPGYASKMAHEYLDTPAVLDEKITLLSQMIRCSKHCLAYTGAGLSTASGIDDYATRSSGDALNRPVLRSPFEAQPTYAHRVLVSLYRDKLLHYWVQQNHDGLPQKAGLPQEALNEIHGSWYDPSNPVVPMSGNLRSDLFSQMLEWENIADLTLSLGTSMCGMNRYAINADVNILH